MEDKQYHRPFRKVEICATVLQYAKVVAASTVLLQSINQII